MGMMDSLKVNPLKNLSKPQKTAVIGGSVAVGGYVLIRHHSKTGSWNPWSRSTGKTSGNDPSAIDPVTGLAYSQDNAIDPITNLPYLQEAQQYGSVQAADDAVSSFGTSSPTGTGSPPGGTAGTGQQPPPAGGTSVYENDAAWAQAATAGLADIGFSETDVATALGNYLQSIPMTQDQAKLVRTAIAEYGKNPSGLGQIILIPDRKPGETTATVPFVIGQDLVHAQQDIADAGLKSSASGPPFTSGKGTRVVTSQTPESGTKITRGSDVKLVYKITGAPKHGTEVKVPGQKV